MKMLSPRVIARRFPNLARFHFLGRRGFVSDDTEQSALVAQSLARHPTDLDAAVRAFRRSLSDGDIQPRVCTAAQPRAVPRGDRPRAAADRAVLSGNDRRPGRWYESPHGAEARFGAAGARDRPHRRGRRHRGRSSQRVAVRRQAGHLRRRRPRGLPRDRRHPPDAAALRFLSTAKGAELGRPADLADAENLSERLGVGKSEPPIPRGTNAHRGVERQRTSHISELR